MNSSKQRHPTSSINCTYGASEKRNQRRSINSSISHDKGSRGELAKRDYTVVLELGQYQTKTHLRRTDQNDKNHLSLSLSLSLQMALLRRQHRWF